MTDLKELAKHPVFKNFIELTKIPRPSYHEKEVSDYLVSWAKERDLEVIQDRALNVIIKKKAAKGYEEQSPVIIQGHMDMVPEKASDSNHDFLKDPLKLRIIDGNLYATNTTLGADNGIAVAMAMAALEDENLKSPALEVLVTTAEEVGMDGAIALDGSLLKGKRLLNIDSEEEGIFFVSCAGGNVCHVEFSPKMENNEKEGFSIEIKGFIGGHSGMEIIKQRGNAIKVMGRLLNLLDVERIGKIEGGAKHNAIARTCKAEIITGKSKEEVDEIVNAFLSDLKAEYSEDKPEIIVNSSKIEEVMDEETTKNIISYMGIMPDGVINRMMDMENMVESSLNLGVLDKTEEGKVRFVHAVRSSRKSKKLEISSSLRLLANLVKADFTSFSDYPEWQFEKDSKLKDLALEVYKKVRGKEGEIKAVHAGLECGILKEKLPNTEMISFGPNMADVHTPNEHLSIESTLRTYEFLVSLLEVL